MRTSLQIALALFALSACDIQKIGNQATATTVAVSTLLSTPSFEVKAGAIAGNGLDASLPDLDAGAILDAGFNVTDAGYVVPAQNLAFVFFGQRGSSLDVAPTGTAGATASLIEVGGPRFTLDDQGGGSYALSPDAGFTYKDNATYQFEFKHQAQTFVAEVTRVPTRENIPEFHPAAGYLELTAGQELTFTRPDPPQGQDRNFGFVNVFPISAQSGQGQPTYTNIPTTALGFLKLIAAPNEWKSTVVTIPGTAFPDRDANYIVVLQSAKLGGPKSDNLFSGSAILAGTADVAIVKTRK
ncbi:MAG: hypothetical protein ACOZQL_27190 [Myxococcota bacterium]